MSSVHKPSPLISALAPSHLTPGYTPGNESGYDTGASAPTTGPYPSRRSARPAQPQRTITSGLGTPERDEARDEVGQLHSKRYRQMPGVLGLYDGSYDDNASFVSLPSRVKADKMLGLDTNAKLASFYLISGMSRDPRNWTFADMDATRGLQPVEDSLGVWWRPDLLGSAFSGSSEREFLQQCAEMRHASTATGLQTWLETTCQNVQVPDAGPDAAQKIVSKTMKYAHPRDLEVLNSTLAPPATSHTFTFTLPRIDKLAEVARSRLNGSMPPPGIPNSAHDHLESIMAADEYSALASQQGINDLRALTNASEITFYGVTVTIWSHADPPRAKLLSRIKQRAERGKTGLDSLMANPLVDSSRPPSVTNSTRSKNKGKRRTSLPWMNKSGGGTEASEAEGMSDSDFEGGKRTMRGLFMGSNTAPFVQSVLEDEPVVFEEGQDIYWLPFSITLVSRFPIYDLMQDFLRISWARYSKNIRLHMEQICHILNTVAPRPGETFTQDVVKRAAKNSMQIMDHSTREVVDEPIVLESIMPGCVNFENALVNVDFHMWPFFQAISMDHILTCIEIALSNAGKVVFYSKHPAMISTCVNTLKYILDLRGWNGVAHPILHARDMTLIIEDPGPYIIGMPTEARYMVAIPPDVAIVEIDSDSLVCKAPPDVLAPKIKRDKMKSKILAALGDNFPHERSVPLEFKISNTRAGFHNITRVIADGNQKGRPAFLGDRLKHPPWWHQVTVLQAFDRVLLDRHKKPNFYQRLTRSGMGRQQAQLTIGEQLVRRTMRRRALHYVDARDDFEYKVGAVNRRLMRLIQESEHWKQRFEQFEKHADKLASEANELKSKIERERREAKRLSHLAHEQIKHNTDLEEQLAGTEMARAEAMRQLSDMHQSIQELEREKEQIMDIFEAQINNALEGLPNNASDTSRPGSPTSSAPGSPKSTRLDPRVRPVTGQSSTSHLSRFTMASQPMSVLGAVTKGPRRPLTSNSDLLRSDGVNDRIASIAQKLEIALGTLSGQQNSLSSLAYQSEEDSCQMGNTEALADKDAAQDFDMSTSNGHPDQDNSASPEIGDDRRESTNDTVIETPVASRPHSTHGPANSTSGLPILLNKAEDQAANGNSAPYPAYVSHPSSLDSPTSGVSPDGMHDRPIAAPVEHQRSRLEPSVRRGISLRIKPRKIENDYAPANKSETNSDLPALESTDSLEHGRFSTSSTAGEIVTPSGSQMSVNSAVPGQMEDKSLAMVEKTREKTMSISSDLSGMTVTFGHSKRPKQQVD